MNDAADNALSIFNTTNAETGFLWLLSSIKSKHKILKCNSVQTVFRGQRGTQLEPRCLEHCLLILITPQHVGRDLECPVQRTVE